MKMNFQGLKEGSTPIHPALSIQSRAGEMTSGYEHWLPSQRTWPESQHSQVDTENLESIRLAIAEALSSSYPV